MALVSRVNRASKILAGKYDLAEERYEFVDDFVVPPMPRFTLVLVAVAPDDIAVAPMVAALVVDEVGADAV